MKRACFKVVLAILSLAAASGARSDEAVPSLSAIVGGTTDYVYRGVSLNAEKPSPILYLEGTYASFYANVFMIGTELGSDALGRGLGNLETDITAGYAPAIGDITLNFGARYTAYLTGRDIIAGTLTHAERDFIEPFAGAKWTIGGKASIGATVFWTPDYYNETGEVTTIEGQAAYLLPAIGPIQTKAVATIGHAHSERRDIISPGYGYTYFNAGLEGQLDHLVFDLRYWDTDIEGLDLFGQRVVFSLGMKIP